MRRPRAKQPMTEIMVEKSNINAYASDPVENPRGRMFHKNHYLCRNAMAMGTALDKETSDKVSFITFMISEFALAYKMKMPQAYRYLKQYGGLDYLMEHWWALHTDNKFYALKDLYRVCYENGGLR